MAQQVGHFPWGLIGWSVLYKKEPSVRRTEHRPPDNKMKQSIRIILLACLVVSVTSVPVTKESTDETKQTIDNDKLSTDIFSQIVEVNKELMNSTLLIVQGDILERISRNAGSCRACLWPKSGDGTVQVPYTLDSRYNINQQNLFTTSIQEYESLTCVRFVNRATEDTYLYISSTGGCLSRVGRVRGAQSVNIGAGCMYRGIIQHELNHVLGFYHENSRMDRDNYITVNYTNISPGSENNFAKVGGNTLGLPYDYESTMHYSKYAYSKYDSYPTIEPIPDPDVPIGQRDGLSVLDVAKINKLYNCNVCSTLLNAPSGSFTSDNHPANYSNNMNCLWLIRTPDNQVSLTFNNFSIQNSKHCIADYIRIYDGPSRSSPMILNRTCGNKLLPTIIASTNQMLIEFVSDGNITSSGFNASYSTVQCGGTFFGATSKITSPGLSSGSYRPNLNCVFNIYAPIGFKIKLKGSYDIENTQFCYADRLTAYGSGVVGSPRYVYCGTSTFSISSTGNKLLLTFQSDIFKEQGGFNLTYSFDVCGTLLNTARGSFSSTNVPSNYSNNTSCVWLISVPEEQAQKQYPIHFYNRDLTPDSTNFTEIVRSIVIRASTMLHRRVSLTFDNFSIEYSPNCSSDYVRIYDGPSRSSPLLLNNTCGNTSLPAIIASTNQMLVEFVRDSNSASSGFRASYNQVQCGGTFMAATSTITSPGYDAGFYPPNLNCEFNIYAPPGYKADYCFNHLLGIILYRLDGLLGYRGRIGDDPTTSRKALLKTEDGADEENKD
ncbi:embryonic protein UVS.2-like [Leptodactylus fuscus]|uniref:embryonic protein UVS.2-like n=1 Tax=Leptodactylus fuscus TaxID=238119 RepID=UPI003F4EE12A